MGKRLKEAAKAARYGSASLGEKLGFEDGTVRGWWNGRSEPSVETLIQYAELTGRSLEWLMTGSEAESPDSPEGWLARFDRLRAQGVDADTALQIATSGPAGTPTEPLDVQITAEERQLLQRMSPDLLWENLSADQQARLLLRLKSESGDTGPQ